MSKTNHFQLLFEFREEEKQTGTYQRKTRKFCFYYEYLAIVSICLFFILNIAIQKQSKTDFNI